MLVLFFIPQWLGTRAKPLLIKLHTLHTQPDLKGLYVVAAVPAHKTAEDPHTDTVKQTHARTHVHTQARKQEKIGKPNHENKIKLKMHENWPTAANRIW